MLREGLAASFCTGTDDQVYYLFLRWKLVDDFVAANKTEILPGDAFQIAAVAFERQDLPFQLLIFISGFNEAGINLTLVLLQLVDAQQSLVAKDSEEKDECDTPGGDQIHLFLES